MSRTRGIWRTKAQLLARCEQGDSLLEFTLSLSIVLTTMFGIIMCSLLFYADHFVGNAAREATRYAMVRGSTWNGAACSTPALLNCTATAPNITTYVNSRVPAGITAKNVSVSTRWPGTNLAGSQCDTYDPRTGAYDGINNPTCAVIVTVNYSFRFSFPFLPARLTTLSSTAATSIVR